MKKLSIVIACYFNEMNIPETYKVLKRDVLDKLEEVEVIFVDDGSKDNTLQELMKVREIDKRVKVIKLSKNYGEHRAIIAGMSKASGDAIAVMSADLQDPPYLIMQMYEEWCRGEKVVIAARSGRDEPKIKKFFANTYYKLLRSLVIKDYPPGGFDFFVIDREVADVLVTMQEKNSSLYVQLIWTGFSPKIIEYVRQEREKGKSMWTYGKRINLFIDTFIVFSNKPIRWITTFGSIMSLVGFLSAIWFVLEYFMYGTQVAGWTSLIVSVLVISGVQLIMLGIIGEYLWRNLDESRKRPLYIIEDYYDKKDSI